MSEHTPGPWSIAGRGYTIFGPDDAVVISSFDAETEEEEERYLANARLIAAAPDLLAALEEAVRSSEVSRMGGMSWDEMDRARAAIAKARGNS